MRVDNSAGGFQPLPPSGDLGSGLFSNKKNEGLNASSQTQGRVVNFGKAENSNIPSKQNANSDFSETASTKNLIGLLSALLEVLGKRTDANNEKIAPNTTLSGPPSSFQPPLAKNDNPIGALPKTSPVDSEKDVSTKPTGATGRPEGDNRSAEDIIEANPILKNLGNQKDINREGAYKQLGDWTENNKDPKSRADAAYNAAKVLNYIDTSNSADGKDRGSVSGKGDLYGITKDGDARHGTPAGNWKDFTEKGYGALKDDHRLDKSKDPWVYSDGTNKSEFKGAMTNIGQKLAFIPGLSNVLKGMGETKGGFFDTIGGGFNGVLKTWKNDAEGVADAIKHGKITPNQMLFGAYKGNIKNSEDIPEQAKEGVSKLL